MSEQSQIRTRMFARVLGPFFTIVPTTVAVRGSHMRTLFTEFQANPMWPVRCRRGSSTTLARTLHAGPRPASMRSRRPSV